MGWDQSGLEVAHADEVEVGTVFEIFGTAGQVRGAELKGFKYNTVEFRIDLLISKILLSEWLGQMVLYSV